MSANDHECHGLGRWSLRGETLLALLRHAFEAGQRCEQGFDHDTLDLIYAELHANAHREQPKPPTGDQPT